MLNKITAVRECDNDSVALLQPEEAQQMNNSNHSKWFIKKIYPALTRDTGRRIRPFITGERLTDFYKSPAGDKKLFITHLVLLNLSIVLYFKI